MALGPVLAVVVVADADAQRREHGLIESDGPRDVADGQDEVIEHCDRDPFPTPRHQVSRGLGKFNGAARLFDPRNRVPRCSQRGIAAQWREGIAISPRGDSPSIASSLHASEDAAMPPRTPSPATSSPA